jgi:hypothetical protein
MSHLSPERLAALIDEQPTAAELAHLAACRPCSRERGAYEALSAMSKPGPSIGQPLTSWSTLAPALAKDGIIDNGRGFGRRARISRAWLQAAAAVLLMIGGVAVGRATAPDSEAPDVAAMLDAEPKFESIAEAQAAAARAQGLYQAATEYAARHEGVSAATPAGYKTRLAALDQVSQIAAAALEEAPYDPVVNNIYLTARGQREASIRMLNTASTRLTTY